MQKGGEEERGKDGWRKEEREEARHTSHPQPDPWIPSVAALNSFFIFSSPPKSLSIAALSGPSLRTPPLPPLAGAGAMFFQNSEWLMWPDAMR
jgi:hypothetical protein